MREDHGSSATATGQALADEARDVARGASAELSKRFLRRAREAGLVDVAYTRVDSPLGPLALAATERGLIRLAYLAPGSTTEADVAKELAATVSPRVLEERGRLDPVRRELEEYFTGRRRLFDLPIDWRLVRGFGREVLDVTARIEYGETASYTEVARRAGSPRAYRAAGNALNRNPVPIVVPCHRVLQSGGALGGYGGGLDAKRFLLELEGAL
jgi:methylated-DNA-[protein]-cysteine S-methyltransferase